jgi:hypothetical protein
MKSLLEAAAILMLFFLTPVIVAWALFALARVIENMGDLPIDESETLVVLEAEPFLFQAHGSRT